MAGLVVLLAACSDSSRDLAWCRAHEGELQVLGWTVGVDYSALNKQAADLVPDGVTQEQWESSYWSVLQSDATWLALCRQATDLRHGADDWTAPPDPRPSQTPPPGGSQ